MSELATSNDVGPGRVDVCVVGLDVQSEKRFFRVAAARGIGRALAGPGGEVPPGAEIAVVRFDGSPLRAPGSRWVLAVVASGSAVADAFAAGADDVLLLPFDADEVDARLALAVRQAQAPRAATPRAALAQALGHPRGGEVIVRVGDQATRIHVHEGRIVWVHRSGEIAGLSDVFPSLDRREAAELTRTARESRRHFADVLVDRGRLDAAEVREGVRRFVEARLAPILDADGAVALFAPGSLAYHSRLSFERREVARPTVPPPAAARVSSTVEVAGREAWTRLVAYLRSGGACSAAVLDTGTGGAVVEDGDDLDGAVAWGLARLITLGQGAGGDVMLTGERTHLARAIPGSDRFVVYVAYDDPTVNLALARHQLAGALASLLPATPDA